MLLLLLILLYHPIVADAKVGEYARKFGWEARDKGAVYYIANHDSTIKSRNIDERLTFSSESLRVLDETG